MLTWLFFICPFLIFHTWHFHLSCSYPTIPTVVFTTMPAFPSSKPAVGNPTFQPRAYVPIPTVGTPPPDATWHTFSSGLAQSGSPWCHVAHISIRISSIRISSKGDTWRASPIRTSSGRSTRHSQNITSERSLYYIRKTYIPYPNMFVQIID